MMDILDTGLFPPRTALEIYKILPEGTRCEVIENVLYMLPRNTMRHQEVTGILLKKNVRPDREQSYPFTSYRRYFQDLQSAFQPDFVIVRNENRHKLKEDGIYEAPDTIIEILIE